MDPTPRETTIVGSFTGTEIPHQMTIEANGTGTIGQVSTEYNFIIGGLPFNGNYHTIGMSKNATNAYMRFNKVKTTTALAFVSETTNIQLRWGSRTGAVGKINGFSTELIIWNTQPTTDILSNIEDGMNTIWKL